MLDASDGYRERSTALRPLVAALPAMVLLLAFGDAARADPANAATPQASYDGTWLIDATASGYLCPFHKKRVAAIVQGGQLTKLSIPSVAAAGEIGPDGAVGFQVRVFGVNATVRGRMNGGTGAGDWSSNSVLCGRGDWRAHAGN